MLVLLDVTKKLLKMYTGKDYIKCYHKWSKSDIIYINKRLSKGNYQFFRFVKHDHWITLKCINWTQENFTLYW